jgi:hypothetical protein
VRVQIWASPIPTAKRTSPLLRPFAPHRSAAPGPGASPSSAKTAQTARAYLNTDRGPWLNRSNNAFVRKSARMQQDYTSATLMISALRYTLTRMKLDQDVDFAYIMVPPDRSTLMLDPPCEVDEPTMDPAVTPEQAQQWVATSTMNGSPLPTSLEVARTGC